MDSVPVQGSLNINACIRNLIFDCFSGSQLNQTQLNDLLQNQPESLALSVKGAIKALEAKNQLFPALRWLLVLESVALLDKSVLLEPENIDIRLLRWMVQSQIPSFRGLSSSIPNDQQLIQRAFNVGYFRADQQLQHYLATKMKVA